MTNRVLVIQDNHTQVHEIDEFMAVRSLKAEYCYSRSEALQAIKLNRYRCVVVSTDMLREDPIDIIDALRHAEAESGISSTQIIVAGKLERLTQSQITHFGISGRIRSHHLK